MTPTEEMLARWAAEELWDWRVRMLFGALCVASMLIVLGIYLVWGRSSAESGNGAARRYIGRTSFAMLIAGIVAVLFFKEPISAALAILTAFAIELVALSMPVGHLAAGAEGQEPQDGSQQADAALTGIQEETE